MEKKHGRVKMKIPQYSPGFASNLIAEKICEFLLDWEIDKDGLCIYFT